MFLSRVSKLGAVVGLLGIAVLPVRASTSRCGGDGPNPLNDITGSFSPNADVLHTAGSPQEFLVWEKRGSLVYRNEVGEVWTHPLRDQLTAYKITQAPGPLARFHDPAERFLATASANWIFDAGSSLGWVQLGTPGELRPVFSEERTLYGVELPSERRPYWNLYQFNEREGLAAACPLLTLDGAYQLASGHTYPYIYFYESLGDTHGNDLVIHRVDVSNCSMRDSQFRYTIKGNIQAVFFFNVPGAVAVKIDNPTENLLWNTDEGGCRYYNIDNLSPLQLNPDQPFLATQPSGAGITLIDLQNARKARVMRRSHDLGVLKESDVYLSGDGSALFVRAAENQRLLQLQIDPRIWTQDQASTWNHR
jgi:hypothetical protein